jgi:hypothetical protein
VKQIIQYEHNLLSHTINPPPTWEKLAKVLEQLLLAPQMARNALDHDGKISLRGRVGVYGLGFEIGLNDRKRGRHQINVDENTAWYNCK